MDRCRRLEFTQPAIHRAQVYWVSCRVKGAWVLSERGAAGLLVVQRQTQFRELLYASGMRLI